MRIVSGPSTHWMIDTGSAVRLPRWAVGRNGHLRPGLAPLLKAAQGPRPVPRYHLTVLTTTACNLGCGYCFQNVTLNSDNPFQPGRIPSRTLTPEVAGRIGTFVREQMTLGEHDGLDLLVFGGEPLLNPRAVFALLEELNGFDRFRAHMVSNGVRLDRRTAGRLVDLGLSEVQVTFDGPREEHDAVRVDHRGRGTYDTIVANVANAVEHTTMGFNLRVNVTLANAPGIAAMLDELATRLDPSRCRIHFAVVDANQTGFAATASAEDLERHFLDWHLRALTAGFRVEPPVVAKSCSYCDTVGGRDGAVVSADGRLYSCWDSAGQAGFEVGDLDTGYAPDTEITDRWVSCGYQAEGQAAALCDDLLDRTAGAVLEAGWRNGGAR